MSRRVLVVAETDPTDGDHGKLFGLDPADASGVPLPTFREVSKLPVAGSIVGEAVYDAAHNQGFVWGKNGRWLPIAPNPILTYDSEAELLADSAQRPGTYATAGDTGSLFIQTPTGWRQVGIKNYPSAYEMFADFSVAIGTLGEADDEGTLWEMTDDGWRLLVVREMADTPDILAWDEFQPGAHIGDRAVDMLHDVSYIRTSQGWRPTSIWSDTETNIRASNWAIETQEAISTDTGRTFTRINDTWMEEPIQHYDTEGELLAADVPAGTLAWADDTNNVFAKIGDRWIGTNTGFYDPTPIGTISAFPTGSVPAGWLLCDGQKIPDGKEYDALRALLGKATVPDLRGQFLRGAASSTDTLLDKHQWTTGKPRNDFITGTDGVHHHTTTHQGSGMNGGPWEALIAYSNVPHNYQTSDNGAHWHHITQGGDPETAPDHVKIHWCIKAKFATLVPANSLMVNLTQATADGDLLSYDGTVAAWRGRQWMAVNATAPVSPQKGFNWYNPAEKVLSVFDGSKWMGVYGQIKNVFQADVTLGANAAAENDIILIKNIPANNGSLYISLGDEYGGAARSAYELHAILSSAAVPKMIPIHIDSSTNYLYNFRLVWIDSTDQYALVARVAAGNTGVKYRVGLFSSNTDLSNLKADGNTLCTTAGGPKVDVRASYPVPVQHLWSESVAQDGPLHKLSLEPVKRYVKLDGTAWCNENYTVRPYFEFGGTEFNLFATASIFHVFAICCYETAGIRDTGDSFITSHGCGITFRNHASYSVKSGNLISFRITIQKRGGGYWDIWQESFFGSDNDTPMKMESRFQIQATGEMTGIGFRCYDWTGATEKPSQHALQVEAM